MLTTSTTEALGTISGVQWFVIAMASLGGVQVARWLSAISERVRRRILSGPPEEAPAAPLVGGECVCGKVVLGEDLHVVVALSEDDGALGIEGGRTAMSADFCTDHCPGGCLRGCVASEA